MMTDTKGDPIVVEDDDFEGLPEPRTPLPDTDPVPEED
jgi:hypothetical protein